MQDPKLTDVHQALSLAASEPKSDHPMITGTYRIEQEQKKAAEDLARRHGTTLSGFLRQCCHALIRDYSPKE